MATQRAPRRGNDKGRQALNMGLLAAAALLVLAAVAALVWFAAGGGSHTDTPADVSAAGTVDDVPEEGGEPTPEPTAEPTAEPAVAAGAGRMTPEEQRIHEAEKKVLENCTKDAPQIKDPETWNAAGKTLMDRLEADPAYQQWEFSAAKQEDIPFLIGVNRAADTVTIYAEDSEGRYTVPYMAMVCSTGPDTPLGWFSTPINYDWRLLYGPCYGQYATRIVDSILFHSVPYYTQHKDDLEYDEYNELGTPASLGCIRLMVVDVKWIYDNCPIGTPVVIYDDAANPGPMGKPGTIAIDRNDENTRGWDPTDPDSANPWPEHFRSGTTIRCDDAWADYDAAVANGTWAGSINPADLRGESTDADVEGTRG